ncbi:glutathione S-transferase family protein [Aquisalimonas lutea]|uniref:glutathione S-transferase family protein n=1 Tax=Aquisalimonas lutea TaxID=1327750 RepID=UPI0025B3985E|nr:glutathione S-transferase family protein [Aquisalimonas lutea]MDN3517536.1 glutathione S-transferase family protein [Aquisalimonas lutea]
MTDSTAPETPDHGSVPVLYGVPHSLYTGIARCYLRTQGIGYVERTTAHPAYTDRIMPAIKRGIIPVVETPDGTIIQDSLDIIDHFEAQGVPYSAYPAGPLQRVLGVILQYYGMQGMLRHAMHYRWSYREQQEAFLRSAFSSRAPDGRGEKVMARMSSYLPRLGVTEATIPAIEQSYGEVLAILNRHFAEHPYVFGGRPTIADYGLIGPLFAHLGRDPVPAGIMKTNAPWVFRWVERMTAPGLDAPEFPEYDGDLMAGDAVPETLVPLLGHMAGEMFPELTDKLAFMDALIEQRQPADGTPVSEKPHQRAVGIVDTHFRGVPVQAGVEPYLVYVLRRADRALAACTAEERDRVLAFLGEVGLEQALPGDRGYSVDRRDHVEVWQR